MASRLSPTSISEDQFREIFGNSDEEFDENDSDIDFTGFEARRDEESDSESEETSSETSEVPPKQKLYGRSNFQTLK